jgi:hypothetical protein
MSDANIIRVNVANFVTITIMGLLGFFLAGLALKAAKAKQANG